MEEKTKEPTEEEINLFNDLYKQNAFFLYGEVIKENIESIFRGVLSINQDKNNKEPIYIYITSPGGHTDIGYAFIDLLRNSKNNITTIALGEISSMAADIFITGNRRFIGKNTATMIHTSFGYDSGGNHAALLAKRKYEDFDYTRGINHYLEFSKYKTIEEVKKFLIKDTDLWLSPEEMLLHGLADEII